jgi:hypothetical protein
VIARIYSLLFVALLVVGFIYQESYMQMRISELSTKIETDKLPLEVFSISPLQLHQYKNGELVAELSASEARFVTTGKLTAQGNVQLRVVDNEAEPAFRLATVRSERFVATSPNSGGLAFDVWGGDSKFERLEIPGDAEFNSRGHVLTGRAFNFDASNMTLATKEPVRMVGPGRTIEARGLESDLKTRSFKFVGPVKGTETPPVRAIRVKVQKRPARKEGRRSGRSN